MRGKRGGDRLLLGGGAAFALGAFASAPASGAAWTLGEDQVLVISTAAYAQATRRFDDDGEAQDGVSYTANESRLFGEVGLRDWATATTELAFKSYDYEDSFGVTSQAGLEPVSFGVRVRLWSDDSQVLSVQPAVRFRAGLDGGQDVQAGGEGSDVEARALYGWGGALMGFQTFVNVEGAYRWRSDAEPDEARLDLTLGAALDADWQILVQSFTVIAPEDGAVGFPAYRQVKGQMSAVYHLDEAFSVQAGVTSTLAGQNTIEELGGFLSVWWRFAL